MEYEDADTQRAIALGGSDLINMLDALYPEQSPNPNDSERLVWMKAGQRELIRKLIHLRADAPIRRR